MTELKLCPFCGGEGDIAVGTSYGFSKEYEPHCRKCGVTLGIYSTEAEAIAAWNRRPEPRQLTLEELKRMEGQPVWTCTIGVENWSCEIVCGHETHKDGEIISMCSPSEGGNYDTFADNYGVTWLAYDRPPGGKSE